MCNVQYYLLLLYKWNDLKWIKINAFEVKCDIDPDHHLRNEICEKECSEMKFDYFGKLRKEEKWLKKSKYDKRNYLLRTAEKVVGIHQYAIRSRIYMQMQKLEEFYFFFVFQHPNIKRFEFHKWNAYAENEKLFCKQWK